VPTFAFPERAAYALGRVASYGAWRGRPAGAAPSWDDVDADGGRTVVEAVLDEAPSGRQLSVDETQLLLDAFGLRTPDQQVVDDEDGAAAAIEA
jgi:acyl-CoA synthetase (NDP forming)